VVIYNGKSIYNKDNLIKKFPPSDQYEKQVTNFSNHVLKKSKLDYNLDDAKKNMKVIDALFQSLKSNKWINL
jgi:predicted dehydrogenase